MRVKDKIKKEQSIEDKKEIAYNFFINKGYSPHISAGIVGNIMQESMFDTDDLGFDGTGSFGIAQWLGPRKKKLKEIKPNTWDTLQGQLEFVHWELNNTESRAQQKLLEANDAREAALLFSKYYERPHEDYAHNEKRANYAYKTLLTFSPETVMSKDKNIYGVDSQGNYITLNPNTATKEQKTASDIYKKQFYLTNYDVTPKNTTFAQQNTATPTPTEQANKKNEAEEKAGEEDVWKQKLQQKINERSFLIGLVNQGATDFIGPQRQQSTAVQQIQQSYMQDGGQIPTTPNGLYDYPDAEQVIVPTTNGRITMKNINFPVLGISQETGQQILMQPNKEYIFPETKTVLEIPQRHGN